MFSHVYFYYNFVVEWELNVSFEIYNKTLNNVEQNQQNVYL